MTGWRKTMRKKNLFKFIIVAFTMLSFTTTFAQEKIVNMEDLAIAALNKKKDWTTKFVLSAKPIANTFIKKHKIMKVEVSEIDPPVFFFVAIGENKNAYVFSLYEFEGAGQFSKLIKDENKRIDGSNIRQYLKAFLLLVDDNALLIEKLEDIKFFDEDEKNLLLIYRKTIKPVEFRSKNNRMEIRFFSWGYGIIYEWEIIIKQNGEILSCNRKELNSEPTREIS